MALWIFLRGLTREAGHWGGFVDAFERALPGARVIAIDLPGNGTLHHSTSPLDIAALVTHCRMQLASLGHQPPYRVLGMSMGAMVTAQWACEAPHELAAAVLINTSFRPFSPLQHRLRPRSLATLVRMLILRPTTDEVEAQILQMTSNQQEQHQSELARWQHIRRMRPVRFTNVLRQLVAAARFRAARQAPATPLLLLGSEQDQLVNVHCTLAIARCWHSALALHPTAGHDLPLDDPDWVIHQVRSWHHAAQRPDSLLTGPLTALQPRV